MIKYKEAQRSTNGFTLIEMLMVVFLFGLVMTLSGALFSAVLKGSSKSDITKEVKQTGDYAMAMMERSIRNAKTATCAGDNKSITILDRNGYQSIFRCLPFPGVFSIASNSAQLTSNNVTLNQSVCSGDLTFTCTPNANPPQVKINFTLYQKGTSTRPEDQASVYFQSTVNLRTY